MEANCQRWMYVTKGFFINKNSTLIEWLTFRVEAIISVEICKQVEGIGSVNMVRA